MAVICANTLTANHPEAYMYELTQNDRLTIIGLIQAGKHPLDIEADGTDRLSAMQLFMQRWDSGRRIAHANGIGATGKRLITLVYPAHIEVFDIDRSCDIPWIVADRDSAMVALMRSARLYPVEATKEFDHSHSADTLRPDVLNWPDPRCELTSEVVDHCEEWTRSHEGSTLSDPFDHTSAAPIASVEDWLNSGAPLDYTASMALLREVESLRQEKQFLKGVHRNWPEFDPDETKIQATLTIDCPKTGRHTRSILIDPDGVIPIPKAGAACRELAKTVPDLWSSAIRESAGGGHGSTDKAALTKEVDGGTIILGSPHNPSDISPRDRFIEALIANNDPVDRMGDYHTKEEGS